MRAIQPPWHGWEKINLMNSGCEGKAVLGHSHWEQRRKETVSCYLAAVWSQGVVWAWVSCWSQAGPLLHKALVAAPRQSHCLWDTPGSALRSLSSFQQATPVNMPLFKKKSDYALALGILLQERNEIELLPDLASAGIAVFLQVNYPHKSGGTINQYKKVLKTQV